MDSPKPAVSPPEPGAAPAVGARVAPHLAHWPRRLPPALDVPQTTLWFNLEVSARRHPGKAALVEGERVLSYAELHRQAVQVAGWLQAVAGVARGDRVLLFLPNGAAFVAAFYGVQRADAVVVPVNPMNRADEFGHFVTDPEARVAVVAAALLPVVLASAGSLPPEQRLAHVVVVGAAADAALPAGCTRWEDVLAAGHAPAAAQASCDDLALLPYTSGTTGMPKGCMHTHRTLMANAAGGAWTHFGTESVALAVVPMFHITGMLYGVLAPVYQGATVVVMPRWDRDRAAALIARHRVTHWVCIPTMIIDLFGSPDWPLYDLSSLRSLSGGGAAMPEAVAARVQEAFGITFAEGYGLTETAAPTHANPPERAKRQCLGMPIFGVDSRVVDPQTLRELPPGEVGEIVSHGPMLFQGYWRHPQATREAFVEIEGRRFFRTGDLGRMDEEGYFFITDRLKRMINASGFKVWPSEVELLLYRCPLVQEACVVAAPDAYRGETVKAYVVLRPEAKALPPQQAQAELLAWAREHIAAYKVPRLVEFADSLPRSGAGKVLWRVLQERERQRADGG